MSDSQDSDEKQSDACEKCGKIGCNGTCKKPPRWLTVDEYGTGGQHLPDLDLGGYNPKRDFSPETAVFEGEEDGQVDDEDKIPDEEDLIDEELYERYLDDEEPVEEG